MQAFWWMWRQQVRTEEMLQQCTLPRRLYGKGWFIDVTEAMM